MIRTTTLDNGLQVVTESMPDVASVSMSFWVGTGSRDESTAEWGMSHFLEHLLFKGTGTRSSFQIAQSIDAVGGDMNAFTTKELTSFYIRVLGSEREMALDILCDIMCDPAFDPKEVEAERQVVLEEILMRGDEPADLVHELFDEAVFGDSTLAREILGDEKMIEEMPGADIKAFFEKHYQPKNLVFAAAGALDHDQIVDEVQQRYRMSAGGARPSRDATPTVMGKHSVHKRRTDQAHVVLGVNGPDRRSPQRYAASVLEVILGGGMSARLFQEVREKRGLAYSVFANFAPYDQTGTFSVYAGSAPQRVGETVDVIREQLALIADRGVTAEEVALAKRNLMATSVLNLEDSGSRMSRIGRSLLQHGNVLSIEEVQRRIEAVSVEDVDALSATLFAEDPTLVAIGPLDDKLRVSNGKVA